MGLCRNCAKMFCENRDNLEECNEKVTFLQANILDQPLRIKERSDNNDKNK